MSHRKPTLQQYRDGILNGDRILLAKAITLVESTLKADQQLASALLDLIISHTGNSTRIGITGPPGVGKSTFIETFGLHLIEKGKKVAVLSVDPTSSVSKGSILGDKTRMSELAKNPDALIRPSASGSTLGGVAHKTRESILLCEAAGFDVIIIETVGVGQSEIAIKSMVDFFLLLVLPGAGDELQAIKKGIMEMADAIVVTKADGDNIPRALEAKSQIEHAIHLQAADRSNWQTKVLTASAPNKSGIEEVFLTMEKFITSMKSTGVLLLRRKDQNLAWMKDLFRSLLENEMENNHNFRNASAQLEREVAESRINATTAARQLLEIFKQVITSERRSS